jgi:hypothetical protein
MIPRKNFYENLIDMKNVEEAIQYLGTNLTFTEILKVIREISSDMVCYYSEDTKGYVYNGSHSEINILQATKLQRALRDICDLFNQSLIQKREFDEDYIKQFLKIGYQELSWSYEALKKKCEVLENKYDELKKEME